MGHNTWKGHRCRLLLLCFFAVRCFGATGQDVTVAHTSDERHLLLLGPRPSSPPPLSPPRQSSPAQSQVEECKHLLDATECDVAAGLAFVHVNKAGGGLISSVLSQCKLRFHADRAFPVNVSDSGRLTAMHMSVTTWQKYLEAAGIKLDRTFFFASVRNPYERMVSNFYYHANMGMLEKSSGKSPPSYYTKDFFRSIRNDSARTVSMYHDWLVRLDTAHPVGSAKQYLFSVNLAPARDDPSAVGWLKRADQRGFQGRGFWFDSTMLNDAMPHLLHKCLPECPVETFSEAQAQGATAHITSHPPSADHYRGVAGRQAALIVERQMRRDFDELGYVKGVYSGPPPMSSCSSWG